MFPGGDRYGRTYCGLARHDARRTDNEGETKSDGGDHVNAGTGTAMRFTVVATRWDRGWDVFLLDREGGLLGQTRAPTHQGVERAARRLLSDHAVPDAHTAALNMILKDPT